jgi:hypothetical protein
MRYFTGDRAYMCSKSLVSSQLSHVCEHNNICFCVVQVVQQACGGTKFERLPFFLEQPGGTLAVMGGTLALVFVAITVCERLVPLFNTPCPV